MSWIRIGSRQVKVRSFQWHAQLRANFLYPNQRATILLCYFMRLSHFVTASAMQEARSKVIRTFVWALKHKSMPTRQHTALPIESWSLFEAWLDLHCLFLYDCMRNYLACTRLCQCSSASDWDGSFKGSSSHRRQQRSDASIYLYTFTLLLRCSYGLCPMVCCDPHARNEAAKKASSMLLEKYLQLSATVGAPEQALTANTKVIFCTNVVEKSFGVV